MIISENIDKEDGDMRWLMMTAMMTIQDYWVLITEQGVNHFTTLMTVITEILEMLKWDQFCSIKTSSAQLRKLLLNLKNFCSPAQPPSRFHLPDSPPSSDKMLESCLILANNERSQKLEVLNLEPPLTLLLVEFWVKLKLGCVLCYELLCVLRCELPWQWFDLANNRWQTWHWWYAVGAPGRYSVVSKWSQNIPKKVPNPKSWIRSTDGMQEGLPVDTPLSNSAAAASSAASAGSLQIVCCCSGTSLSFAPTLVFW